MAPNRFLVWVWVVALLVGCRRASDEPKKHEATATSRQHLISDQAHGGPANGFFFLPPMVANPNPTGPFAANLAPVVVIDERNPAAPGAVLRVIATYTIDSGPDRQVVRDDSSHHYMALWQTRSFDIDTAKLYRINVLLDGRLLGFADVRLGDNGAQLKVYDETQFVTLIDGQTLPIKFRLNPCAPVVCAGANACRTNSVCDPNVGQCVGGTPSPVGTSCSDANACNGAEICDGAGTCVAGTPPVLDDSNPCTADTCTASGGVTHTPVAAGTACSDGNACNGAETCNATGTCMAGTPLVMDDGNPCTADACSAAGGVTHTPVASGTGCGDGNACNGAEACNATGACQPGTAPATDDGNPCTSDSCDPVHGVVHTAVAAGTACGDANVCNGAELCNGAGTCAPGTPPSIDDGNPCTADSCDAVHGVRHLPVAAGTSCSDGDACNGAETCNAAGTCAPGTTPTIDDSNPCTVDTCDALSGVSHTPVAAGTSCSDGNACNGAEACNATGSCRPGTAPAVDDSNPCTSDACDPASGVTHTPVAVGTSCSDGNACNGLETCDATASCTAGTPPTVDDQNPCTADSCSPSTGVHHTPVAAGTACADGDACNGAEKCNATGTCIAGAPPSLDDHNPCTADSCDAIAGVQHTPVSAGTSCADTNACNGEETCDGAGSCTAGTPPSLDDSNPCTTDSCSPSTGVHHTPVSAGTACSDGDACNGAETCDANATCTAGTAPTVDDSNPCTTDSCSPTTGVHHTPVAAGTSCSDGNVCNGAETCNAAGTCAAGTAPTISDGNACTEDACDPVSGVSHTPVAAGTYCPDGNACNGSETCDANGACMAGTPPSIDDENPCTADACSPNGGVTHTPVAAGTSCSDGDACNGAETCNTAGACAAGTTPNLDDSNPCTADSCDATTGVHHTPVSAGTSCADTNACNGEETCNGTGSCTAGTPPSLDDSNPCTADSCSPSTGVHHTPVSAGTACSDGDACNGAETCDANATCTAGTAPTLDDSNPCTTDSCSPTSGVHHTPVAAGTSCSDGNVCNGAETCNAAGSCAGGTAPTISDGNACTEDACDPVSGVSHTPVAAGTYCPDGNACNGSETCDANGACMAGTPPSIDDENPCTADACSPSGGVTHTPVSVGTSCSDGNACNGAETCNAAGTCAAGTAPSLDDHNPCTADSCDASTGVHHTPVSAGTSCADTNACNGEETCNAAGSCTAGTPPSLDDSNPCTTDACTPGSGITHTPVATGTSCSDHDACNGLEACDATGSCSAGTPPTLDDLNPCTTDSCSPSTGVHHTPVGVGTSCSDGNTCNGAETCNAAGACTAGTPPSLDDNNPCTSDACDPTAGVTHTPAATGTTCSDGNVCNGDEACDATGACVAAASTAPPLDDNNPCTSDTCDPELGVLHAPVPAGTSCSDADACNGTEVCNAAGACTATPGSVVTCTALDVCHLAGTCNPTTGACSNPRKPECPEGLPPDPSVVAPPLDRTATTTAFDQTKFLYTGDYPIQTGVAPGAIQLTRAAEVSGRVIDQHGAALSGVTTTVVHHPELGQTLTRLDGRYDLAVNGGQALIVDFKKDGYLPAQRTFEIPWQEFVVLPDVIMLQPDPNVTPVAASSPDYQVARGSVVTDEDGTRQGTMIVPPGTQGVAHFPNGTTMPLPTMSLRFTEYTVGTGGENRMPGSLPPTTAYTYAFEVNADEAVAAGADSIELNQPVPYYVDNFLNFPAGTTVPLGSYDRDCGRWESSESGKVIKILSITGGLADLDSNGDGAPDSAAVLAALSITDGERQKLAELYEPGKSLWRSLLPHFSVWDKNWPVGPPPDAVLTTAGEAIVDVWATCPESTGGASVDTLSQTVFESEPITGTSYNLMYESDRVEGREALHEVTIPVSGPTVPASLLRIELEATVAGRKFTETFPAAPDLGYQLRWDGKDAFGRELQGVQPIHVRIGFVYPTAYLQTDRFGYSGNGELITADMARREITLYRDRIIKPTAFDVKPFGLGGWNVDVHHAYDPAGVLFMGDGRVRNVEQLGSVVGTIAGGGLTAPATGVLGKNAALGTSDALATAPDGSTYIMVSNLNKVFHVGNNGVLTHVAGTGAFGYNGDERPATQAQIWPNLGHMVMAPECEGGIYFVDNGNNRIRHIDGGGIIHTIVGSGVAGYSPPGTPPKQQRLLDARALALGSDCTVYYTSHGYFIYGLSPDGVLRKVAGCGSNINSDGGLTCPRTDGPATQRSIVPIALAAGPDGSIYFIDLMSGVGFPTLRRIGTDGIIRTIAGGGTLTPVDGATATSVRFGVAAGPAGSIDLALDGTIYFTFEGNAIWSLSTNGTLRRVIGQATFGASPDGVPARSAAIRPRHLALRKDGTLVFSDVDRFRTVNSVFPGLGASELAVASEDGREVYTFDGAGRHLRTLDVFTKANRILFGYDPSNRLATITDLAGKVTTLQHDAAGKPTAIVAPFGQTTTLQTDADGFLSQITNPAGESAHFTYDHDHPGRMATATHGDGAAAVFAYDAVGRLAHAENGAGGTVDLSSVSTSATRTSTKRTALGVQSTWELRSTEPGGTRTTRTLPSGLTATRDLTAAGVLTTSQPDGTTTTITQQPDPRFGMQVPVYANIAVRAPSATTFTQTANRTVTLTNPADPFSASAVRETTSLAPSVYTSLYDGASRTLFLSSPMGSLRSVVLDTKGRGVTFNQSGLTSISVTHDAQGRVATIANGARTRTFGYDPATGTLASVTDPMSRVTTFTRDAAGRVTSQTLPDNQIVQLGYDDHGHLASMTPPGRPAHLLTHTALGQLSQYTAPALSAEGSSTTGWAYDADQRLLGMALPDGSAVTLGYDAASRLARVAYPTGTLALSYDALSGRIAGATGPDDVSLAFTHDGRLPRQVAWSGDVSGSVTWGYDKFFKVTSESVNGSSTVSFAYDQDGLVSKAGQLVVTRNNGTGLITGTTLRGVVQSGGYDTFGALTSYSVTNKGAALDALAYTRDALGRITTRQESVRGGAVVTYTYTYDARGRLFEMFRNGVSQAKYETDANSNRTKITKAGGAVTNATFDVQDRLLTHGALTYGYDANGRLGQKTNTSTSEVTHYGYDAVGNLRRVDLPDGRVIEYLVDAAGRRVAKKVNGAVTKQWIYRDATRPAAELDAAGNIVLRFVYADGAVDNGSPEARLLERLGMSRPARLTARDAMRPAYVIRGTETLRIVTDHLGSPRFVVDVDSGAVVEEVEYDPLGAPTLKAGTYVLPTGFAGGLYDPDTGLVRLGARDYDPEVGRWTAQEPIRTAGTLNAYEYAGSDPLNNVDLDGLATVDCPDKQAILDAICGPNSGGTLHCTVTETTTTTETIVSAQGTLPTFDGDRTGLLEGGTDLPALHVDGDGTTTVGTGIGTGGGNATPNVAPAVTPPANFSVAMPANNVPLNASVTNDGRPEGYPQQYLWYTAEGPDEALFADPNVPATTVTFVRAGVYVLTLVATDGEYQTAASVTVTVTSANQPPVVLVSGPATADIAAPAQLTGSVTDDGLPAGSTVTSTWSKFSGPGTATFATPNAPSTLVTFSAPGTYQLRLTATDGALTTIKQITVNAAHINHPPSGVSAGPDQALAAGTSSTSLAGTAADDGLPNAALSYTWTQLSGPATATFGSASAATTGVTLPFPGTYVFAFTASDGELSTSDDIAVTVDVPAGGMPTVAFQGLVDDATITKPTTISANISEGAWALEYRLGGRDDVDTAWTVLASGSGAVNGSVLGTFDPTLMLNGLYTVRLSSKTSAGEQSTSVAVVVDGRMKIGLFTLSFLDIDIPVNGEPMKIIRTYDSRARHEQDFGAGWSLDIKNVRVEKAGKTGAYWEQSVDDSGFLPVYCLHPTKSATVTVTMSTGRVYRFRPKSFPECQTFHSFIETEIKWENVSDPGNNDVKLRADNTLLFVVGGVGAVQLLPSDGSVWDPKAFTLTSEVGSIYSVDQKKGLTQKEDLNGNTLRVTHDGIISSSGKSIRFERDEKDRITKITDPNGDWLTYEIDDKGDLLAWVDRAGNRTRFTYAGDHYLQDIFDPLNRRAIRNEYDTSGRLVKTIDVFGKEIVYGHDFAENREIVADRFGRNTIYEYNQMGDVVRKTDAAGGVWTYEIDARGNETKMTDPLGHVTRHTYDAADNVLTTTDALNHTTTTTYGPYRTLLTTRDPNGHTRTNGYDGRGNLISAKDAMGHETKYTYDVKGNRVTETDPLNHVTRFAYDADGRMVRHIDALGHARQYSYDSNGRKLSEATNRTTEGGLELLITTWQYDGNGKVVKTTFPDGSSTASEYTVTGKLAAQLDGLGRRTSFSYDSGDRLIKTTRADGTFETSTYDAEGRRDSSTDAAGHTTAYEYDAVGRLTKTTFVDGAFRTTGYDLAGRATSSTDETGHTTLTEYDDAGRVIRVTDPLGHETETVYDLAGNATSSTDPLGHTTVMQYDPNDRQTGVLYVDGATEQTQYDAAGRQVAKIDPLARTTRFGYDALGRLTSVTDALNHVTSYGYDEAGGRVSQTDANLHTTRFAYDTRGRQTRRTLPDGATEAFAYDAAGQRVARTDFMGRTTRYAYDSLGQLTARVYPDASTVGFTYTPTGQRATATDARGVTGYIYDTRMRLTQMTDPAGRKLLYGYDAAGRRTSLGAKIGATTLTTTTRYDAAGRADRVTDPLGRHYLVTYDAAGNRIGLVYPNTTSTMYAYDNRNRLKNITTTQAMMPGVVQSHAYTLDAAGRRMRHVEGDGTVREYGYDGLDRLTQETVTGALSYAKAFSYDPVGNRRTQTINGAGGGVVQYVYDARDRLLTEAGATYSYDTNGNLTRKSDETHYAWDFDSRLTSATLIEGSIVRHTYDVDGNRVGSAVTPKATPVQVTGMLVDEVSALSHVVAETDGAGVETALYVRLGDELLATIRRDAQAVYATRWVHNDGLGSVRAMTDDTGGLATTRAYEAFGTMNASSGSDPLPYAFAGEPADPATGFTYHRARWMNPAIGRFLSMDPWPADDTVPSTLQRYSYTGSDPANRTDPSGLFDIASISAAITISGLTHSYSLAGMGAFMTYLRRDLKFEFDGFTLFAMNRESGIVLEEFEARTARFWQDPVYEAQFRNGPTPPGLYRMWKSELNTHETREPREAWGGFSIRLHPTFKIPKGRKDEFFLHAGLVSNQFGWSLGTSGCVKVPDEKWQQVAGLADMIKDNKYPAIQLLVNY